jgi:predicted small secreted protein
MRTKLATLFLSLLLLTSVGALLSACGTVHGAGEDLESGSNAVRRAL